MSVEPDFTIFIPHSSQVLNALQKVFRRLLSNLLLDFDNPKYQVVKKNNAVLARNISNLPENITEKLFEVIGFQMTDDNTYLFRGTKKTLLEADKFYSQIEDRLAPKSKSSFQPLPLPSKKELPPQAHAHHTSNAKEVVSQNESSPFVTEDFESVTDLQEIVRKTLLKTGRIRNCFFEANYYSLRRMSHGRVYVCSEKCDNTCLEAHWHLLSGRNILYSHVAHLSSDGLKVLHLGFEVGYQYHMIPGMGNFGKSVNFSTKLLSSEGKLLRNEHPNKVCDSCIYCGMNLRKIFFCSK